MVRGVLLFPGAGSSANHPSLIAIEQALQPLPVNRVDFAYRRDGRRAPDRSPVLIREVHEAIDVACERWSCSVENLVIGGRSMGGRMCSLAVAGFNGDDRAPQPATMALQVAGLVCVSYPLHPPKQPSKLRIAHFPYLRVPSLFVSGTKDEFATPDELRHHLEALPTPPDIHMVDGGRHDLRGHDVLVAERVAAWVQSLHP